MRSPLGRLPYHSPTQIGIRKSLSRSVNKTIILQGVKMYLDGAGVAMRRSTCSDVASSAAQAQFTNAENMGNADHELVNQTHYGYAFAGHRDWTNAVVLECAPEGSPYSIEDVLIAVENASYSSQIQYIGPMSLNYVMVVKFANKNAADDFLREKFIQVKGRQARTARIGDSQIAITLLWIPPDVSDAAVSQKFSQYGEIKKSVRIKCTRAGFEHVETTTRIILLDLNPEITIQQLPYIVKIDGLRIAVGIRNRPPMCYRCRTVGHTRARCTAPHCNRCRRYGHKAEACSVVSYAGAVRGNVDEFDELAGLDNTPNENVMDVSESTRELIDKPAKSALSDDVVSDDQENSSSLPDQISDNTHQPVKTTVLTIDNTLPAPTSPAGPAWGDTPMLSECSTEPPGEIEILPIAESTSFCPANLAESLPDATSEPTSRQITLMSATPVGEDIGQRSHGEPSHAVGGKWTKECRSMAAKKGLSIDAIGRRLYDLRANRVNPYDHVKASLSTGANRTVSNPDHLGRDASGPPALSHSLEPVGSEHGLSPTAVTLPSPAVPTNNRYEGIADETI